MVFFFQKIKGTFFIFTNNFIDLDILSMLANLIAINFNWSTQPWSISKQETARNFANHFWHARSITAPSPYTAQIFFVCFSHVFTFLEIIKHDMPKMCSFFPSSILKWLHKNSPILMVSLDACWWTAIAIQSNKIVLSEVKDN